MAVTIAEITLPGVEFWTDALDNPPHGRWTRKNPQGDAADHVVVVGTDRVHLVAGRPDLTAVLVVQCESFGAVPKGWATATEQFDPDDFTREYTVTSAEEREELAFAAAKASADADAKLAKEYKSRGWNVIR